MIDRSQLSYSPDCIRCTTHPLLHERQHVLGLERQSERRPDTGQQFKYQLDGLLGQRAERRTTLGRRHVGIVVVAVPSLQPQLLLGPFADAILLVFGQHLFELPIGEGGRVDVAKGVGG